MIMRNLFIIGLTVLLLNSLTACGFSVVDTGNRGVEVKYGKPDEKVLGEGLYFYNPFTTSIVELSVRTQTKSGTENTYTKDIQQADLTYTINYNLNPDAASSVYSSVGRGWEQVLIPQTVTGTLKEVIGKWDAVDLIANRDKANRQIEEKIREALAEKNVVLTKFEITNIKYNAEFEKAVEAKVTAIQRASEAENKTRQITEEAKQQVISAKAEAESMKIRSEALAQNKALVDYEAVQKWDGKLPSYIAGNSIPFLNLKN